MIVAIQKGHITLVSNEYTSKAVKIGSTIIIEEIYTLTFPLIELSQSGGSILKAGFAPASLPLSNSLASL